jgi:hypothetical protein
MSAGVCARQNIAATTHPTRNSTPGGGSSDGSMAGVLAVMLGLHWLSAYQSQGKHGGLDGEMTAMPSRSPAADVL